MEKINTRSNRTKYIIIALGIITVASIAYGVYATIQLSDARNKNNSLATSLENTKKQLEKVKKASSQSTDETATDTKKQAPAASDAASSQPTNIDTNFVALLPHGGFLASQPAVTFEWAPHKNAAKYVVEIKKLGQANYPTTYSPDSIVTPEANRSYESFSLKKTLQSGDYVWRVTALKTQDGQDVAIQSTEDRNYQIR